MLGELEHFLQMSHSGLKGNRTAFASAQLSAASLFCTQCARVIPLHFTMD